MISGGLVLWIAGLALLLAGCASAETSAWSASNPQSDCERRGAVWRPALGFCEYQSGGGAGGGM